MKLGATITSERGKAVTKTGNENIKIDLLDESGACKATVIMEYISEGNQKIHFMYNQIINPFTITVNHERVQESIGNLKHGKCKQCAIYHNGYCDICGQSK